MNVLLATVGVTVLLLTMADMARTTVRLDRPSGPVTRLVARAVWRTFAPRGRKGRRPGPPAATGFVITSVIVVLWLGLTLLAWFLIFSAERGAVIDSGTGRPAGAWDTLYYAAFTLSTLGVGDYVPNGALWQVLTGVAATAGFAIVTLVITYVMSLTAAVMGKRRLGRLILSLGDTPERIVLRSWDGAAFTGIDQHLVALTSELHGLAEQHLAYPVLYYFRSEDPRAAHWPAVAVLSEALLVLDELVDEQVRLPPLVLGPPREAIESYLSMLPGPHRLPEVDAPPPPDVATLRERGVPLRPEDDIAVAVDRAGGTRRLLWAVLRHQGWSWPTSVTAARREDHP
ncbi:potassium channel family protein [Pseudonocardia sp. RS010]|uniref:potassium channel family protein n=1 Tax=Pseudonocardia sp. RS010 TaxID=3385979 RepID=UPI0039A22EB4